MSDPNRFGDDRYGDQRRQDDYRTNDPYGRAYGQSRRYPDEPGLRSYEGASRYRGERFGQNYDAPAAASDYERRSFSDGHDPFASSGYTAYGEEAYRNRRYGSSEGGYGYGYNNRQPSDAMLHQGYQAPFGPGQQDRNAYRPYQAAGAYQGGYAGRDYGDRRYSAGYSTAYGPGGERGFWDQTRDEVASWFGDDEAARRRRMDSLRDGQHRGRGPKGYTRSDDRIREDVNDRLTDDYLLDATDIEVKIDNGEITLSGHVHQRMDKRRAEDLVDQVPGVKHVQNNLRVKDGETATFATGTTGTAAGSTGTTAGARSN